MTQGIGNKSSERWDVVNPQSPRDFPRLNQTEGPSLRHRDARSEGSAYTHSEPFSLQQRQELTDAGIAHNGASTVYLPRGENGAVQYYHVGRILTRDYNGLSAFLQRNPSSDDAEFTDRLERIRTEHLASGGARVAGGLATGIAGSTGGARPAPSDVGRANRGGPHGPAGNSGPGRHGGGGAPRGPHGGGGGGTQHRGGTATATMPTSLQLGPRPDAANNAVPFQRAPQSALQHHQQALNALQPSANPLANAAGQFAQVNAQQGRPSTQTAAETQNPGLIPGGLGAGIASGARAVPTMPAPDTTDETARAVARGANFGRPGGGSAQREDDFGLADMDDAPQDSVHGPDARARNEEETDQRLRRLEQQFQNDRGAAQTQNEERSAQVRRRLDGINASVPAREDFQIAADVVDALPETLGPKAFAAYEEIMSDPIWRRALEDQAHNPRFLEFVQSIIAGNIEPQVAINRLRNDDPNLTTSTMSLTLPNGRDWTRQDVERLLRPNEQDAFRRYAEAFPDIAEIVFGAGYDASPADMAVAIRALLNGAYGQDVAAWLREGGLAGGRVPPGGNTPYVGTGAEFPEPEKQPETGQGAQQGSRIIVPGGSNDQRIPLSNPQDDADPSAPSIITPDQPSVTGTDEPQIWTPGTSSAPIKTGEDLENAAALIREARRQGIDPGNTFIALLNRQIGHLPHTINDVHSHEGPNVLGLPFGPGFGSYDPRYQGVRPPGLSDEQWIDMTVDRLITQSEEMGGGQTAFYPVAPSFRERPEGSTGLGPDGRPEMDYYLSREYVDGQSSAQTILGVLTVNRAEGTVSTNQMIDDRYGQPAVMPFSISIRDFEELIGRSIDPDVETIEFVSAPAGCQLHFRGPEVDEGLAENFAALIAHENATRGTNLIAERYVLGLTTGNPREDGSHRNIYAAMEAAAEAERRYGLEPGTVKVLWGETNLSKEIVHSLGGQTPLVHNTPEEKANLTRWAQAMGETGMPVIIHCDSGTAAETDRLNTTGSLSALRLPSNNANIDSLIEFAQSAPDTTIVWAHAGGLGFTVQMPPDHLDQLRKVLAAAPNVVIDMSWDAVHPYIAEDPAGWARLIADHPTRFIFGTDTIATTQNPAQNSRRDVAESMRRTGLLDELDRIDPDLKEALFSENYNTHIRPGLNRAAEFRTNPENAEWLGNGAEGPPPLIWQRGADGEYLDRMIRNPARGE